MSERHDEPLKLTDYAALLRRRSRIVLGSLAVGFVLSLLYLALAKPAYTASSSVSLRPITSDPFAPNVRVSDGVSPATEKRIMTSRAVAEQVADALGPKTKAAEVLAGVKVTNPPESLILEVEYSAASPEAARKGAQAFADSYLDYRQTMAEETVARSVKGLKAQLAAANDDMAAARETLADAGPTGAEASGAQATIDGLSAGIDQIQERIASLQSLDLTPGVVTDKATSPEAPSGLPPLGVLLGFLGLGLTVGVGLAFLRDRTDPRLRSTEDLVDLVGDTPINIIRQTPEEMREAPEKWFGEWYGKAATRFAPGVLVAHLPAGEESDSYRRLGLRLRTGREVPIRYLLVTAAGGAACEEVASNLAVALGREGEQVLLIWSNLHEDTLSRYFSVPRGPGLGDVLSGRSTLAESMVRVPGCDGVSVLPIGSRSDAQEHFFKFAALRRSLESGTASAFDTVILLAPSPTEYADALALAPQVDGVLLAVSSSDSDRREVTAALDAMRGINAPIVGVVAL